VDPAEYATYQVFVEIMSVFSLFVLLPLMADVFKWHETTQNVFIGISVTSASFLMAATSKLWPGKLKSTFSIVTLIFYKVEKNSPASGSV